MPVALPILTNSAAKAARSCLRKYRNRYVRGLRPLAMAEAAELGDLVHIGLEAWWLGAGEQRILDAVKAVRTSARRKKVDSFQVAKAEALLIGYHARWADEADQYEVISVEAEFRAALINPDTAAESKTYRLGGKMDVVVRERATGRMLVVEHKTSSEDIGSGSFYWLRLHMDSQVSMYFDGGRALGHDVQGCLYDVIGKPDLRPLKATPEEQRKYTKPTKTEPSRLYANQRDQDETPPEFRDRILAKLAEDPEKYFERGEVARDTTDLADAARDLWQLATILRDATRLGRFPRNPDACMQFGHPCEFLEACAGRADLADPFLFRREANPHSELTPELAGTASGSEPSREETAA